MPSLLTDDLGDFDFVYGDGGPSCAGAVCQDIQLLAPCRFYDLACDLAPATVGLPSFTLPSSPTASTVSKKIRSRFGIQLSTKMTSPFSTRYCFPPVTITAYIIYPHLYKSRWTGRRAQTRRFKCPNHAALILYHKYLPHASVFFAVRRGFPPHVPRAHSPLCRRAALTVFFISMARVIRPTPPGTGVM